MSSVFGEREAIKHLLESITEERARLWEESRRLLDRLRELDSIDSAVVEVREPLSLVDKVEAMQGFTNPSLEIYLTELDQGNVEDTQSNILVESKPVVPALTLEEAVEKHNALFHKEEDDKLVYDSHKEGFKDFEYKNRNIKRRGKFQDMRSVAQKITAILKEAGIPLKTAEIIERAEAEGISMPSPHSVLYQVKKYEPKIMKVKHGYYQYKW